MAEFGFCYFSRGTDTIIFIYVFILTSSLWNLCSCSIFYEAIRLRPGRFKFRTAARTNAKSSSALNAPPPPLALVFVIILSLNLKGREEMTPSVSFIHVEASCFNSSPPPRVRCSQISAARRDGVTARLFLFPPRFRGVFKFDFADNFKVATPPTPPPSRPSANPLRPPTEPSALL